MPMKPPSYPRFPATLQAAPASQPIRPDMGPSVSEATRALKEALATAEAQSIFMGQGGPMPVTGQYYDQIRARYQVRTHAPAALTNPYVRGIYNKAGGVPSFAAAGYNYPSGQMVIGAALAGYSSSPSEERKRQMAQLLGLGNVGKGVEACGPFDDCAALTGDFALTVPASELNSKLPADQINFDLMNISWMSGAKGCRTEIDNRTGQSVLGLKPGKSTYASNAGIVKVKAAAVAQAMYDTGIPLTIPNLYNYGQLKAHDVGELRSLMKQYPPGTGIPSDLTGDGSSERSTYCNWATKVPSKDEICAGAAKLKQQLPGCPPIPGAGGGAGGGTPGAVGPGTGTGTGMPNWQILPGDRLKPYVPVTPPPEEKSNTGMIIGGVVALGLVGFLLTRRR